jgi:uncharacterized repeat protein (TIGR01451 family)
MITDTIPGHAEVVETAPPGNIQGQQITWKLEALPPGAEQRYAIRLRPVRAGDLQLEAAAVLPISHKQFSTRIMEPPLQMELEGPASANAGQKVAIKMTLANKGGTPLKGLQLQMTIPEGLKHPAGKEIIADIAELGEGKTKVVDVSLQALKAGRFTVMNSVTYPGGETLKKDLQVVVQEAPGLVLKKVGLPVLVKGKVHEYRIEIVNQGAADAQNVVLTETLPEGIDFFEASDNGMFNPQSRTVQWLLGPVKAGHVRAVGLRIVGQVPGEAANQVTVQATGGVRAALTAKLVVQPAPSTPGSPGGLFNFQKGEPRD